MKKFLTYMGVDRAVAYTLFARCWSLLTGVLTLLLVLRFLTPEEQGYYYTFSSILAMQILFELGMSYVVMQFASHEMANLFWSDKGTIEGDDKAKTRIHSLLMLVTKWYGVIAALVFVVILPVGWIFFSVNHPHPHVNWHIAWVWLVLSSAVNIVFLPLLSLIEGCGHVTEVAHLRMCQSIVGSLVAWTLLIGGGGLLAMPAMSTSLALTVLIWLWYTKRAFLKNLFFYKAITGFSINWRTEIWPFQWRIALSWLSGYFIFQLFTPILFIYYGPEEAGKMGVSFSIANALMSVAMAWMNTQSPKFGTLISRGDYQSLDHKFALTLTRSIAVMAVLAVTLCAVSYFAHVGNFVYSNRILDPLPFALLMLATIFNYVTYAQSTYLRAHKEEPFLVISLISAVLILALTIILGKLYGSLGVMSGYLTVCSTVGLLWGSIIFASRRQQLQRNSSLRLVDKV